MQNAIITKKEGTLTREELHGKTFESISPDEVMHGCGFMQQNRLKDSQYYIAIHYMYVDSGTPEYKVQAVYAKMRHFWLDDPEAGVEEQQREQIVAALDRCWPEAQKILREQPATTEIMLDYGYRSLFILPYVLRGANAMALAIAYGKAYDILGNFRWVPLEDLACFHIIWEAICVGVRLRGAIEVEKAIATDYHLNAEWELALLGAGVMAPWLLQKNVPLEKLTQNCHISAVDMDPRCANEWLPLVAGAKNVQKIDEKHTRIPRYNIDFYTRNIIDFCQAEENQRRFMGVHTMGVFSYYRSCPDKALGLMMQIERTVKDDGYHLMDLQLKTTQSIRNSLTFWSSPALKQDENFNEACDFARWLGDKTGTVLKVVGCDIELEEPSTAVFCYTKPKIYVPVAA